MADAFGQWSGTELEELKKVFFAEAAELVDNIQESVLRLEADHDDTLLKAVKRYVHTLKGDSHSIGLSSVGALCHRMEDVLELLMERAGAAEHEPVDLLLRSIDVIRRLIRESEAGGAGEGGADVIRDVESFLAQTGRANRRPGPQPVPEISEYQKLLQREGIRDGRSLYEAEIVFHPLCGEKSVAARMVAQRLGRAAEIIRSVPDVESGTMEGAERLTVLFTSDRDRETIRREIFITGITHEIGIREIAADEPDPPGSPHDNGRSGTLSPATGFHAASEYLRIEASRVDRILDLVGELIIGRSMIDRAALEIEAAAPSSEAVSRLFAVNAYLERTIADLQKGAMKMRMVPIQHVFRKLPKIVRDLSLEKGKAVRLEIEGKETELDKGIVDALGEPLTHIVRNMVDHGIEAPAERRAAGKPEEGRIVLRAFHEASQIVIEATDDGRGIDTGKLKRKAVDKGFVDADEAERMTDTDAVDLMFLSGLSTAETVTETSGRGVGMDAVKAAVESLKGSIEVSYLPGKGTTFTLRLPLTLAVIRALLFRVSGTLFALPLSTVAEITKVPAGGLATVDGRDALLLRDRTVSVIRLDNVFGLGTDGRQKRFVLLLDFGGRKIGLMVDRIEGQQELVVKAVEGAYSRSRLVAGASILGDGTVVVILDAPSIVKKYIEDEKKGLRSA